MFVFYSIKNLFHYRISKYERQITHVKMKRQVNVYCRYKGLTYLIGLKK